MNNRFHGKAGEEYKLFTMACPHFEELETQVWKIIQQNFLEEVKEINVLEIWCGPGYTTSIILDSDKRTKVTAIDNEPKMISQAKEILTEYLDNQRVVLIEKDALEFLKDHEPNSFDVFASGFTLHNFPKEFRNEVLKEIYKVLKPNWIFINADKYALDNEFEHKKSLERQLAEFKNTYNKINRPDLIEEWTSHYLEDNKPETIMRESESIEEMKIIGYQDIVMAFREQMEAIMIAKKI